MHEKLIADVKDSYGLTIHAFSPVSGGYLNAKWRVATDRGSVLVKQFSFERYNHEDLEKIETALGRQMILEKDGVPCPRIWPTGGRAIRQAGGMAYMVMDFCAGKAENPDTITVKQMCALGSACALMHAAFTRLSPPPDKRLPRYGGYTMDQLWANFRARTANRSPDDPIAYHTALCAMEPILKKLDASFFNRFPQGYAHEDFQPGNLLFTEDGVSAILDFDRNHHSYPLRDVGRAILSFALNGNALSHKKIRAFREGYSLHSALGMNDIADALRLVWCIETAWWIQPAFFRECAEVPRRFKEEVLFITEHFFDIDSLLGA